ncbi:MTRF1L release factor glutamine methyltransferase isoform X2 [Neodiprion lecontei]|uniref:peptide chain release factor N(5)-glutamine methyltransferase n=1 Tax=Neodiprion lecontei TaxID=441921 RepID=A0ABM3G4B9_NEOLC|nr:MTRF1L release factor glutamine methyltransferase isoform X2 [Neodiprion lecontei]
MRVFQNLLNQSNIFSLTYSAQKKRYSSNTVIQTMDLADAPEQRLSLDQITKLQSLCQCRMSRMPVQYIIGEWDFRDITLKLVPPVFIPRPETEILVDIALRRMAEAKNSHYIVLDIGCGSGAISLALVHSSNQIATSQIQCTSVDKSLYACELTRQNAEILGLQDKLRIVNAALRENGTIKSLNDSHPGVDFDKQQFDIIISNPPYIPTEKLMELAPEIKIYEDLRALDGGKDGLSLIKAVLRYASKALIPRGLLFMEVDPTHPEYIEFFTKKYTDLKLKFEHTYKDYCNNDRFVELSKLD